MKPGNISRLCTTALFRFVLAASLTGLEGCNTGRVQGNGVGSAEEVAAAAVVAVAAATTYHTMDLIVPEKELPDTAPHVRLSDRVGIFLHTCVQPAENQYISSKELAKAYEAFSEERGWQPRMGKAIRAELTRKMAEIYHVSPHDSAGLGPIAGTDFLNVALEKRFANPAH